MAKQLAFNLRLNIDGKEVITQCSVSVKELASQLDSARTKAKKTGDAFSHWTQQAMGFQALASSLQQLSGVLNSVTDESRSFAGAMKVANTMAGKNAEGFAKMKDEVAELAKRVPLAREELANGLYQVISNGVPEDNWLSYLEASSRSAVGGVANLGEVVKVTSTIIKNYALDWADAQSVQDKIQLTAKNGVTSFEQLAAALPSVTGQAAQLGVSLDEMLAVMSTLTGVTGNTSEVSTQLASILTALTKESSKAQKVADAMGISFNAASVKACGGLQGFLQEPDKTITAYANKTGQLKESIYSQLFGRAEALRAVNALTGEMAGKFGDNIQALEDSAGTMDAAFQEMASTGSATMQLLKNSAAVVTDYVSGFTSGIQPLLAFGSQAGMTLLSVIGLTKGLSAFRISVKLATAGTAGWNIIIRLCGMSLSLTAAKAKMVAVAMNSATLATTRLKFALRALASATIIGVAIAAISYAVEKLAEAFMDSGNEAEKAAGKIDEAGEASKRFDETFKNAQAETYSRLMTKYGELQRAWKSLSDAHEKAQWIKQNKSALEELGLKVNSVSDAEDVFAKNTDAVVRSFTARSRAAARLSLITDLYKRQLELIDLINAADARARENLMKHAGDAVNPKDLPKGQTIYGDVLDPTNMYRDERDGMLKYTKAGADKYNRTHTFTSNGEWTKARRAELETINARIRREEAMAEKEAAEQKKSGSGLKSTGHKTTKKTKSGKSGSTKKNDNSDVLIADAKSVEDLDHNIEVLENRLKKVDPADTEKIQRLKKLIADTKALRQAAQDFLDGVNALNPQTLDDYAEAIRRVKEEEKTATAEELPGLYKKEEAYKRGQEAMERNARFANRLSLDEIKTQAQLKEQIALVEEAMEHCTADALPGLMKLRKELEEQGVALDKLKRKLEAPADISLLKTSEKLQAAISYYRELQKGQSADEYESTERIIRALEAKDKALQRGAEILDAQKEISEISSLDSKEMKVRIRAIGFDELTSRIKELKRQLADAVNPPTDAQRKEIEGLIATYQDRRRQSVSVFDTIKSGWGAVENISGGIQSMTDAIKGNGSAWEKTEGIINGLFSIMEGVQAIISIIQMVKTLSEGTTIAKGGEAAATTTAAAADSAHTAAIIAQTGAAIPAIVANKALTASLMEVAAAQYYAAHAYIPFWGAGIASSFVTSSVAAVQAVGAMPFAEGGIVSGKTFAMVGEYPGAQNNPEVVAPLDKLRGLLYPPQSFDGGLVRFEVDGRKLVGVIENERRIARKSGRRANF